MFLVGFNHHFGFNTHEKTRVSSCFFEAWFPKKIVQIFPKEKHEKTTKNNLS